MNLNRRHFLAAGASAAGLLSIGAADREISHEALDAASAKPVLDVRGFKDPIIIDSIELLRKGGDYFVRVRSSDGAEGVSVDNGRGDMLRPILKQAVVPYFIGKDARQLEEHLFGVYRYRDNYKLQGLALWCPVAWVEFAILDMLGRIANKPMGALFGKIVRTRVPFYIASGRRDTTPEQEVEYLKQLIEKSGAKAVKYRLGGRMSRNQDAMPGRTEKLIPLSRKALGDKIAIHGDANSSYDARKAIEIGRMMEDINAVFYEEPCPFDDLESTKKVADGLKIPVAGGEQEYSEWRFKWAIRNRGLDVVQPDLHYYGGMIRSRRVAQMAQLQKMPTTVHLSGGFGFVYTLQFASCTPDIGPWQEYKEGVEKYGDWFNPRLRIEDGALIVPGGPGVGVADWKPILADAEIVA
jgi:L-alanine-DL-glutamate epimerase-like enolase superfamily enzyme